MIPPLRVGRSRSAFAQYLVNGDLIIEAEIQVALDKMTWTPRNTVCSDMLKMLESADEESADVVFVVGTTTQKTMYAHSVILRARSLTLVALIEEYDGVEPEIFEMILRFILAAADRFGCTGLKFSAETDLAARGVRTENIATLILFADAKNCALLKEAATDYFVANSAAVMQSDDFAQVRESADILSELMSALILGKRIYSSPSSPSDRNYASMRVVTLREKLESKGLDIDGSKEALISRLEKADRIVDAEANNAAEDPDHGDD